MPRNPHKGGAFLRHALFTDDVFFQTCISFTKRTSDRQAAVTIRSPKPVAFVKIRPARLAVPRRRAGTAFRHRTHEGGLSQKPDGRQYYAWLVKESTGSSFPWISSICSFKNSFRKLTKEMKQTLTTYQELTGGTPDLAPVNDGFPLSDPTAILEDLQNRMQQDFPALADLTAQTVQCDIQDVDAGLEAYSSPAFYMIPPIDALMQNTIRINRSSTADGIELYTTLAHEGYPGHLYQTVYSSLSATRRRCQFASCSPTADMWRAGRTIPNGFPMNMPHRSLRKRKAAWAAPIPLRCSVRFCTAARSANQPVLLTRPFSALLRRGRVRASALPRILRSFGRAVGTCLRLSAHCPCGLFEVLRWLSRNECPQKKEPNFSGATTFPCCASIALSWKLVRLISKTLQNG